MDYIIENERQYKIAMDYIRSKSLSNNSVLKGWIESTPSPICLSLDTSHFYRLTTQYKPSKCKSFADLAKDIKIPDLNVINGPEASIEIGNGSDIEVYQNDEWKLLDSSFSIKWLRNERYIFRKRPNVFTKSVTLPVTSESGQYTASFSIDGFMSKEDADKAKDVINNMFAECKE